MNTNPTHGNRFRVMCSEVMGLYVGYNDNDERRRTHPLLIPKVESERISVADGEVLEKAAIIIPARTPNKTPRRLG